MRSKRVGSPRSCMTATATSAMAASTAESWKGPGRSETDWMATSRAPVGAARGSTKTTAPSRPSVGLGERRVVETHAGADTPDDRRHEGLRAGTPEEDHGLGIRQQDRLHGSQCTLQGGRVACPLRAWGGPEDAGQGQRRRPLRPDRQRRRQVGEGQVVRRPVDGRLAEHEPDAGCDPRPRPGLSARTRRRAERLTSQRHPEAKGHVGRAIHERAQVGTDAGGRPLAASLEPLHEGAHGTGAFLEDGPGVALTPLAGAGAAHLAAADAQAGQPPG